MMRKAVQFGAGNIGRGFLAQLFHESGMEVVFVDVAQPTLDAINERKSYAIQIVGEGACKVEITDVRAIHAREVVRVAAEIADADIVCTAVGASALKFTAPAIAAGIAARQANNGGPLNVLLCENLHNAAEVLHDAVSDLLSDDVRGAALANTGFVQTVVARMVPMQTPDGSGADPLGIRVEAYKRLPVDADSWIGPDLKIVGVEQVSPFEAYVDRKLYTHNCAHAVLGYLGYAAGYEFGYQALHDPRIEALLAAVLQETGSALVSKHHLDPAEHAAHVADLLHRFENRDLGDTCIRLARDPVRKLAAGDRIVGAARCCESQSIEPRALSWAIAAALKYDAVDDPSAGQLQAMLLEIGREATLKRVCGIQPDERLAALVDEAMDATASGALYH